MAISLPIGPLVGASVNPLAGIGAGLNQGLGDINALLRAMLANKMEQDRANIAFEREAELKRSISEQESKAALAKMLYEGETGLEKERIRAKAYSERTKAIRDRGEPGGQPGARVGDLTNLLNAMGVGKEPGLKTLGDALNVVFSSKQGFSALKGFMVGGDETSLLELMAANNEKKSLDELEGTLEKYMTPEEKAIVKSTKDVVTVEGPTAYTQTVGPLLDKISARITAFQKAQEAQAAATARARAIKPLYMFPGTVAESPEEQELRDLILKAGRGPRY